jgi:Fe-S oxidoreductase
MEKNSNPWGVGAHQRADWCADLGVNLMADNADVDVLYWVGCAGAFDERNKNVARSFVKILQKADVKFGILGTEENCTGDSARRAGNEYLYQTLAATNIETLNRYNVKKIVTACPHCFNTLKNEYPQLGGNYEVQHHSEFISDLIKQGKIKTQSPALTKAVLHDSCYLGRYNDVYDAPRSALKSGYELIETKEHGSHSLCCGAGGSQMWMEETHEKVNRLRTKNLLETQAEVVATACPFCNIMITDGVKAEGASTRVLDIAEIVAEKL